MKKTVEAAAIEKARKALAKAPEKAPETKTLSEALAELRPEIEAAISKGYSHADVVGMLKEQGIITKEYAIKALFKKPRAAMNK